MEKLPIYRPAWSATDKIIEILSWMLIGSTWILVLFAFWDLPDRVPVHFNASGQADGYGGKISIFLLPFVVTAVFIFLHLIARRPWTFNYLVKVNDTNYQQLYLVHLRALRMVRLVIVVFSLYVTYMIIRGARNESFHLGFWALPLFLAGIIIPVTIAIVRSLNMKS